MAEARTGGKLFRATKEFAEEDIAKTWRLFATTTLAFAAAEVVAIAPLPLPIRLIGTVVAGLIWVRYFIFYHDYLHGAIFRKSTWGKPFMWAVGLYLLNPPNIWRETHDYHHRNNAKMTGAAIGSYPMATTRMWAMMKPAQRRAYRVARHPLTMLFGYAMIFVVGMCIVPFVRDPKKNWDGVLALVVHFGTAALVGFFLGIDAAFLGVLFPLIIAMTLGAYLFYAQHNFPGVDVRDRTKWDYSHAALRSSSMFDMHPVMHWFTGNIGYHHVHHLNHRIPFYNLPAAMAAVPELQDPGRTSWAPSDVMACLRLKLWDPRAKKMVPFPSS